MTSEDSLQEAFRGALLLQKGDRDVLARAGGRADPTSANSLATRFQLASVSKQFTCAAILVLAERGALDLHDPISRWVEDTPDRWKGITLHHLMTHTAGLLHWSDLPQAIHTEPPPMSELIAMFMRAPLISEPGTKYSYSSPGFVLLALVAQRCAEKSYTALLQDEIFAPLGMSSTFAGDGAGRGDLALGYRGEEMVQSMSLDVTDMGAGDIWSTVGDLAIWDVAITSGIFLSDQSRRQMLTPHVSMSDEIEGIDFEGYGYGWCIGRTGGHRLIFHSGDNFGYQSVNAILPDDDARLVVLTNDETTDLVALTFSLLELAIGDLS